MSQIAVAVKALIKNKNNKYLVLFKSSKEDINPNTYDLPGGRIEFGETPEEAVIREVKEETGLDVKIVRIFNCWSYLKDNNFQLIGIDFICSVIGGLEVLSAEHSQLLWVSKNKLDNYDFPKWLIKTIEKDR